MPTVANDLCQVPNDAESADWYKPEPVEPHPSWGPFLPWRAARSICKLTRGNTQHIALILAMKTPRDGKWFVVQKDFAAEIGRGAGTVRAAIKELLECNLLIKGKRTMGGFDIVWGKVAYGMTEGKEVNERSLTRRENTFSDVKEIRDALRSDLRPVYAACLVARHPNDVAPNSPELRKLALLSDYHEHQIIDNLVFFAISQKEIPVNQIAKVVIDEYMLLKGTNNFLVKARHPLRCLAEDIGRIVCRLLAQLKAQPAQVVTTNREASASTSRPTTKLSPAEQEARMVVYREGLKNLPWNRNKVA